MNPFLSLCIIVKNEEKVLERCLNSVHGLVEEIILVDTGSTDKTKEIAEKYTEHTYDYQWNNSFADARNFAQSKASGEWILVLDADEYLDRENLEEALHELRSTPETVDALSCVIYNFTGLRGEEVVQHHSIRLYRNTPNLHYIRAIHEQLEKMEGEMISLPSKLMIFHTGYMLDTVKEKKKSDRNALLLDKELKASDQNPFDYFNLGNEYLAQGKTEEALHAYVKAYQMKKGIEYSWVPFNVVQIIQALVNLNRYQDALDVIYDAGKYWSSAPDFPYYRGLIYYSQNRYEDAKEVFTDLITRKWQYSAPIKSNDFRDYYPHLYLGVIYDHEKEEEKAVHHFSEAFNHNRSSFEPLKGLLKILSKYAADDEIFLFLEKHNLLSSERRIQQVAGLLYNLNRSEAAKRVAEQLPDGSILKKGFAIKSFLVQREFQKAMEEIKTLSAHEVVTLIQNGSFDFYDHIILFLYLGDDTLLRFIESAVREEDKPFIRLFIAEHHEERINHEYLITLLERSITMQFFEVFDRVLPMVEERDKPFLVKIANLLYRYEFKDLAVTIYQGINPAHLDCDAYVNIIEEFIQKEDYQNALLLAVNALGEGKEDYRIFSKALLLAEKLKQVDLFSKLNSHLHIKFPDRVMG